MCLERLCLLIIVHTGAISLLYTNLQILAALGLLSTPLRPLTHLYWLLRCCATCIQHLWLACDLVLVFLHSASHLSGRHAIGMRNVKAHLHLCWCCNLVVTNRTIENSYPSNSPQLFVPVTCGMNQDLCQSTQRKCDVSTFVPKTPTQNTILSKLL